MKTIALSMCSACALLSCAAASPDALSLAGPWQVRGENLAGRVTLPGSLAENGLGDEQTFSLWQTETNLGKRHSLRPRRQFVGSATYSRTFDLPPALANRDCEIVLERVLWLSRVSLDGKPLGACDALGTPHVYPLPARTLSPGRHTIAVTIDNASRYGFHGNSHGWGWHTQTLWHGIVGEIAIRPVNAWTEARVFAPWPAKALSVELPDDLASRPLAVALEGRNLAEASRRASPYRPGRTLVTFALNEAPKPWSADHPVRYRLSLRSGESRDERLVGFRSLERRGNRLFLNGTPLWIRGDVDNCQFPLTGYPAMTPSEWRRQIRIQKGQGLNAMRFHTWTPPKAAFEAADELGFYLFIETGFWGSTLGGVSPKTPELAAFLERELKAILRHDGEFASFFGLGVGNELGTSDFTLMNEWMRKAKAADPRHLTMASTARKVCPTDDLAVTHFYPGIGSVRCRFRDNTDWDYEDVYSRAPIPVVAHEIGQWCVYPLWNEIAKYDMGVLRAFSWCDMRDQAVRKDTLRFNRLYHAASLKASAALYKSEVESFLRTPSCSGLQLLDVRDYTGQGDALVGWMDAFFDAKPATSETLPLSNVLKPWACLARLPKYVWTEGETFRAKLLVRNIGERAIPAGTAFPWSLAAFGGEVVTARPILPNEVREIGCLALPLDAALTRCRQELRFGDNRWSVFVLENLREAAPLPQGVTLTRDPKAAAEALARGARVIYTGPSAASASGQYRPLYWGDIYFKLPDPFSTLGAWVNDDHPALRLFPTEDWADEQWRHLADRSIVHNLEGLPKGSRPIVMPVPDIHASTPFGTLFEVRVGEGRLLVCGYPLDADLPESRQLRKSLLAYAASEAFAPCTAMPADWFAQRFARATIPDEVDLACCREERAENALEIEIPVEAGFSGELRLIFADDGGVSATCGGRPCKIASAIPTIVVRAFVTPQDVHEGKVRVDVRASCGGVPPVTRIRIIR